MHQGLVDHILDTDWSIELENLLDGRIKVVDGDVPFPCNDASHLYTGFSCEDEEKFMTMSSDSFHVEYLTPVVESLVNELLKSDKPIRAGKLPIKHLPFRSGKVPACVVTDKGIVPVRVTVSYHITKTATDKLDVDGKPIMQDWRGHRVFFDILIQEVAS